MGTVFSIARLGADQQRPVGSHEDRLDEFMSQVGFIVGFVTEGGESVVVALVEPILGSNQKVDDFLEPDSHLAVLQTVLDREIFKAYRGRWKFGASIYGRKWL